MNTYSVGELAEEVSGRVEGDASRTVTGVAPIEHARERDLTFVVDERYGSALNDVQPAAVLAPGELALPDGDTAVIRVENPRAAFARIIRLFHPDREPPAGVSPTAVVEDGAELGEAVSLGPYVVVESGARIGARTRIGSHTYVAAGAEIGEGCVIGSGCSILGSVRMGDRVQVLTGARLGTRGYGYVDDDARLGTDQYGDSASDGNETIPIPQVGRCILGDEVEIGANTTVDRGALGDTVIGSRTKIDNLVHVGHNVRIGEGCMIVAQVGIAGSVEVGDRVQMAGQAGVAGHLTIGNGARIAARGGVIGDVPEGATYSGFPARPHERVMRASAAALRLPELVRRVRELERRLEEERATPEE